MVSGVKFGHNNWRPVLEKTKASYAEVWFRLDWREKYQELFDYLNAQKINFGLHFWAMVGGKYFPSLLVEDQDVVRESFVKICQTLKIARKVGAIPNQKQLTKLFLLFKNKDVWLIPEPKTQDMVANYFALQKIVQVIN